LGKPGYERLELHKESAAIKRPTTATAMDLRFFSDQTYPAPEDSWEDGRSGRAWRG